MGIIINSAEETFLHVGALISISILLFSYINHKTRGRFIDIISENRIYQPLLGAIMGILPGCSGSIIIIPLFIKNKVSFGTIVASLISSMGDSAFLLIASDINLYIKISFISLIAAITTGYLVDILNIGTNLNIKEENIYQKPINRCELLRKPKIENVDCISCGEVRWDGISKLKYEVTHGVGYSIYLTLLIVGFLTMIVAHLDIESQFIKTIHSVEEIIAILGIIASFIYMLVSRNMFKNETGIYCNHESKNLKEEMVHCISDISSIIVWIFLAYIVYDIIITVIGGEALIVNIMLGTGIFTVIIGALLGLIPGCGIQIIIMSFYIKGGLPFAALVANTISQDGDALFPLIAVNKKAAFLATLITTIPAIIVGIIIYCI